MAIITLFEMATQNGEIVGIMGRHLKRQLHTYDIVYDPIRGVRLYRVFLDSNLSDPIMEYEIPDRTTTQTLKMWSHQVRDELDKAWVDSVARRKAALETPPTPAPVAETISPPAPVIETSKAAAPKRAVRKIKV